MNQTTKKTLIEVKNASLIVAGRLLLESINLSIQSGEIVSIVGPNGAGKTTLVKAMIGLIAFTEGQVIRSPKLRIGYMPQKMQLSTIFPLSVEHFMNLGQRHVDVPSALKQVGVQHVKDQPLYALSGGELQRVLLARAMSRRPDLLVLDEPAQGVDLMGQAELYALISDIRESFGCAILLVSHDLNVVMAQTDVVVCLNQHICCKGHPETVSQDPEFAALFGKVASQLAFYTHKHDHHHDVKGEVLPTQGKQHD